MTKAILATLCFVVAGFAMQEPAALPPAFEVASVKPAAPGGRGMSIGRRPGGRFTAENVPLRFLITFAYDIRDHQLTGGPAWINADRWDIVAKPAVDVPNGPEGSAAIHAMVRALLADRFQLKIHKETKEMPVYALVVAKGGPKLTPSPADAKGPSIRMGRGKSTFTRVSLTELAQVLAGNLGRNVIDETGIQGNYDFTLEFLDEPVRVPGAKEGPDSKEAPVDSDLPSLFTAVQEQLGLKLVSKRGPVEIVVIEQAEKATEN